MQIGYTGQMRRRNGNCGCRGGGLAGVPKRNSTTLWVVGILAVTLIAAGLLDSKPRN